jgi:hypothetical protein
VGKTDSRSCVTFHRDFFRFRLGEPKSAVVQKRMICFCPSDVIEAACLRPSAIALFRAAPSTLLAPLNHRLMKGFFFCHGFLI